MLSQCLTPRVKKIFQGFRIRFLTLIIVWHLMTLLGFENLLKGA